MAVAYKQPRGTRAALNTKQGNGTLAAGQVYSVTDESGRLVVATATNDYTDMALKSELAPKGLEIFCSGKPAASEVIGGGIAPYAMTLSAANTVFKSIGAATASTTLVIKLNGTQIGTAVFAAAATVATVTLTSTAVALNDSLTVHAPATADATLSDITGLLRE